MTTCGRSSEILLGGFKGISATHIPGKPLAERAAAMPPIAFSALRNQDTEPRRTVTVQVEHWETPIKVIKVPFRSRGTGGDQE